METQNIETSNNDTMIEPEFSQPTSHDNSNGDEKYVGCVKWFNNKAGYGFVTITSGDKSGTDIFVHHSAIRVKGEQYKYLVQGEYIEFNLIETSDTTHQYQAGNIYGINGGRLMCETRNEIRQIRNQYNSTRRVSSEQQTTERVDYQSRGQTRGEQHIGRNGRGRGRGHGHGRGGRGNSDRKERIDGQRRSQSTSKDSDTKWKYVSREHRKKPM